MKKSLKVAAIMIAVFAVIIALLYSSCDVYIFAGDRIRAEVISYVSENKDTIELDNIQYGYQRFIYTTTGNVTSSLDYGFYYSEDDSYSRPGGNRYVYKNGYRSDGVNGDPTDWHYTEKICDHWYYYEMHDG